MKFSLIHPIDYRRTAWQDCARLWHDRADDPERVEHIVVSHEPLSDETRIFDDTLYLVNRVRGSVPSWNLGARVASGDVLLGIADDLEPCEHWDTELEKLIGDPSQPAVFEVDHEDQQSQLTHAFMTRGYYARFGFLNPAFLHVCVDNVFTSVAQRSGYLVNAKHLHFPHIGPLHPRYVPVKSLRDDLNPSEQAEAFAKASQIAQRFERRETANVHRTERRKIIGTVAYMGGIMSLPEPFAWSWGQMLTYTQSHCQPGDFIQPDHSSLSLHDHARSQLISRMRGDWIVMLDCDTSFEPDLVARLVATAQRHSLDVVSGIYAFKRPPHAPVLYMRNEETDQHDVVTRWDRGYDVFPVDAAGAGCLFIRRSVFDRIGSELKEPPFARDLSGGEDMAFFRRLKKIGVQAWCAWRVEMAHLDYKHLRVSNDYDSSVLDGADGTIEYRVHGLKAEDSLKVAAPQG